MSVNCDKRTANESNGGEIVARADQTAQQLFLYHRFHEPRRIGAEFAHDLVMDSLFDGHGLQAIFGQPQQARIGIGHQHRRVRGHHDLNDGGRADLAVKGAAGKRLTYRQAN